MKAATQQAMCKPITLYVVISGSSFPLPTLEEYRIMNEFPDVFSVSGRAVLPMPDVHMLGLKGVTL